MRLRLAVTLMTLGVALPAAADIPGPHDDLCTIEAQETDGSHCEACSGMGAAPVDAPDPCAELRAREGWSRRCSVGATHFTAIYCDREADFVEVAEGGGCGCRAVGAHGATPWWIGAGLLLTWVAVVLRR